MKTQVVGSTTELARRLGLSRWTVSRALNGHAGINKDTARRVTEEAAALGFAPSILGKGLRAGRTELVGVCLPDIEDYFLARKVSVLQREVREHRLHALLEVANTEEEENEALRRFAAMRCVGVITIASRLKKNSTGLLNLEAAGIPCVGIDPLENRPDGAVVTDRAAGMREAIRYLHKWGHRKVTALKISAWTSYGKQRLRGLKEGCADCGWRFECDVNFLDGEDESDHFALGGSLAGRFLEGKRTSAVLALNDRIATGFMKVLTEKGMRIPQEVSIIGYDNAEFSAYMTPTLTTLDAQGEEVMQRAVERLMSIIDNRTDGSRKNTIIAPRIIQRESVGHPSNARRRG